MVFPACELALAARGGAPFVAPAVKREAEEDWGSDSDLAELRPARFFPVPAIVQRLPLRAPAPRNARNLNGSRWVVGLSNNFDAPAAA
jgi:hypothetical protein